MPTRYDREAILRALAPLVGLPVASTHRAADMRIFHFGALRPAPRGGTIADYGLHIQCPWRLEGPEGLVTGRSDLWEPRSGTDIAAPEFDWDAWDYERDGNLQDERIGPLFPTLDVETRKQLSPPGALRVESVEADALGGAVLQLSRGYRLVIFPAGSAGEYWRLLPPDEEQRHFVVGGDSCTEVGG
jgi:hypothetical protein